MVGAKLSIVSKKERPFSRVVSMAPRREEQCVAAYDIDIAFWIAAVSALSFSPRVMMTERIKEYHDLVEEYLRTKWTYSQIVIMTLAIIGILINCYAAVILHKKKHQGVFVRLLKTLVVSDIIVEIGCGFLWGVPRGVDAYSRHFFPQMAPFLIAISHMAVMSSNFITGVIGFERFVRLKYYCNFKYRSWITNKNLNFYRAAVVIFPILFYAPKFFEIAAVNKEVYCMGTVIHGYDSLRRLYKRLLIERKLAVNWTQTELNGFLERHNFSSGPIDLEFKPAKMKNVWDCLNILKENRRDNLTYYNIEATSMRHSWTYYNIYYMGANTIFGHFLPFVLLVFLNVLIVYLLQKNKKESQAIIQADEAEDSEGHGSFHRKLRRLTTIRRSTRRSSRRSPQGSELGSPTAHPGEAGGEPRELVTHMRGHHEGSLQRSFSTRRSQLGRDGLIRHGGGSASASPKETRLTWISFYIMLMYVFCHIWKLIPNIYEAVHGFNDDGSAITPVWPSWLNWIKDLSHIMVVLNSACNFLPYLWFKSSSRRQERRQQLQQHPMPEIRQSRQQSEPAPQTMEIS